MIICYSLSFKKYIFISYQFQSNYSPFSKQPIKLLPFFLSVVPLYFVISVISSCFFLVLIYFLSFFLIQFFNCLTDIKMLKMLVYEQGLYCHPIKQLFFMSVHHLLNSLFYVVLQIKHSINSVGLFEDGIKFLSLQGSNFAEQLQHFQYSLSYRDGL